MGYDVAIAKAWDEFCKLNPAKELKVRFLADEYSVDTQARIISSLACNVPAKQYLTIILLHYLSRSHNGLPAITNKWLTFKELSGIEGYGDAFRKRVIEPILRKYGRTPKSLFEVLARFKGTKVEQADAALVLEVLERVPVLIELWGGDDEFSPEANVLFDSSITNIFCMEDIIVLAEIVAHSL